MTRIRTIVSAACFAIFLPTTLLAQVFVDQSSGGGSAFVPQISNNRGAFIPQISGQADVGVNQVPLNASKVPPRRIVRQRTKPAKRRVVQTANQATRPKALAVIGEPSRVSPFPTVGAGTNAIVPSNSGDKLPTVRNGAVRL